MPALKPRARSVRPPTPSESRMARESSRRLSPAFAELVRPTESDEVSPAVEVILQVKGRPGTEAVEIPRAALRLFADILAEMARGNAVTVTPIHAELTTQKAADLLNVSRPHLCKLLDDGKIPHHKIGRHRRVRFADLLEYKEQTDAARAGALDELAEQAQALGMVY